MRISHDTLRKCYSQKDFAHTCQLPPIDNLLIRYICNGYFVDLRRKCKSVLVASERHPRSQRHLKSSSALYFEKYKHLQYHYYMIHPFSIGRLYWELFMMVAYYIILVYIPMDVCLTANTSYEQIPRILLDCVCWIDIVLTFQTGYEHHLTKKVIMDKRQVRMEYLSTWFIIDALSSVNLDVYRYLLGFDPTSHYWLLRIPSYLKVFRLGTLLLYINRMRQWRPFSYLLLQVIRTGTIALIMILWCSCLLFMVASTTQEEWMPPIPERRFLAFSICISKIVYCFVGVSPGNSNHWSLRILEFIWLSSGWLLRLLITAQVVKLVMKNSSLLDNFNHLVQEFEEYMKTKKLPKSVKRKVVAYLKLRFRYRYYKESNIYSTLSTKLKQEVMTYVCRNVLRNVSMFRILPEHLLHQMGAVMKLEIFLPNDVVVTAGALSEFMVFIHYGMMCFYDTNGIEICHMSEGDFFGERCLFDDNHIRQATIVAVDFCETYSLNRADFISIMAPYPDLLNEIQMEANYQYTSFTSRQSHVIPDTDVGNLFDPSLFLSYR